MESSEDEVYVSLIKLAPEFISTDFLEIKVKPESEPVDVLLPMSMDQQDIETSYTSVVKLEPSSPLRTSPHFLSCNENLDDEIEYTRRDLAAEPSGGSFSQDSLEKEDSVDSQSDSKSTLLQDQRSDHISHLAGNSSAFPLEDAIRGEDQGDSNVNGNVKSDIGSSNSGVKNHVKLYRCSKCQRTYCRRGDLKAHQRSHTEEKEFLCNQCMKSFKCKATLHRHLKTHLAGTCDTCGKTFTSRTLLVCHLRIHNKQHVCEKCGKLFSSSSDLRRHLIAHTSEKTIKCSKCERCFKYKLTLKRHLLKHSEVREDASLERYLQAQGGTCDTCGKTFTSRSQLVSHLKIHNKQHACAKCGKLFRKKAELNVHMNTHTTERMFKCIKCERSFKSKQSLKVHLFKHSEVKGDAFFERYLQAQGGTCDNCGKTFTSRSQLVSHLKIHNKQHACEKCGKLFRKKAELNVHMKAHTSERMFKCCKCERCFKYKQTLKRHLLKHSEVGGDATLERYQQAQRGTCDTCGKSFFSRQRLVNHIKLHDKQHECKQCRKKFTFNSQLNVHIKTHTAEGTFKCSKCERSFKSKHNLNLHLLKHPEFRGDASFERFLQTQQGGTCDTCGKYFPLKAQLLNHIRIHNKQHACEECGKLYISKFELKNHLKDHTLERRFQCSDCNLCFTSQRSLSVHSHVHFAGFVCSICNVAYKSKAILLDHYAKHAAESESLGFYTCKETFQRKVSMEKHIPYHCSSNPCQQIQCSLCLGSFSTKEQFYDHRRARQCVSPFTCTICGIVFYSEWCFMSHWSSFHSGEQAKLKCDFCGETFNETSGLKEHLLKYRKCNECGLTFSVPNDLKEHSKRLCSRFECLRCHKNFKAHSMYEKHILKCYDEVTLDKNAI